MNVYKTIAIVLLTAGTMTSCLKDKLSLDPAGSTNVIEFKNPADFSSPYGSKYALYAQSFNISNANSYSVVVSYSGANVAPSDITVMLGADTTALKQYNTEQNVHFDVMPASLYTLPASVVIPRGQRTATLGLIIKSSSFDFSKNYVLPLQIKSASTGIVSGNFGTILLNFKAKNQYDGVYTSTGQFTHPVATSSRAINRSKTLATVNATTVQTEFADLGGSGWTMQLQINSDNTVTLIPTGSANASTKQSGTNTYNPATKTYTLNYSYPGSGGDRVISEAIKLN